MHDVNHPNAPQVPLEWEDPKGLIPFSLKVFFLRIITLGIYHFWGKTELRRKIWSAVRLQGQPLQYTGTGWELFLGFVIVLFAVILPIYVGLIAVILYFGDNSPVAIIAQFVFIFVIFYLIGVAQYRARNYRLSRTNWRGIRGHMEGSSWSYGWKVMLYSLTIPFTLGWSIPWMETRLNRILTNETRFGSMPMNFDGKPGPLYVPFSVLWMGLILFYVGVFGAIFGLFGDEFLEMGQDGTPPSPEMIFGILGIIMVGALFLMLCSAWYSSRMYNYFASRTTIDSARFHLTTTPVGLIVLTFTNLLIVLFSLGILTPIAQTRLAKYIITNFSIDGSINFAAIAQSQAALSKTGEGLAEAFDVDAF